MEKMMSDTITGGAIRKAATLKLLSWFCQCEMSEIVQQTK